MALDLTNRNLFLRAAAAAYQVSEKTVCRWLSRAREAGFPVRLPDRSSTPRHQPPRTSFQLEARGILALRRQRRSYAQILMVLPSLQGHALAGAAPPQPQPPLFSGGSKAAGRAL